LTVDLQNFLQRPAKFWEGMGEQLETESYEKGNSPKHITQSRRDLRGSGRAAS
jgi:hypothetical protein